MQAPVGHLHVHCESAGRKAENPKSWTVTKSAQRKPSRKMSQNGYGSDMVRPGISLRFWNGGAEPLDLSGIVGWQQHPNGGNWGAGATQNGQGGGRQQPTQDKTIRTACKLLGLVTRISQNIARTFGPSNILRGADFRKDIAGSKLAQEPLHPLPKKQTTTVSGRPKAKH